MTELHAIRIDTVRRADLSGLREMMPGRMEKAGRYRFERDRLLCLGGGLLMAHAAGIQNESELRFGANGKPLLPGGCGFNLSHSGEWCVLAKGEGAVGVDIERMDTDNLSVAPVVFTAAERRWMEDAPLERFHRLWTWKESVMKALGLGMALEPATFDVMPFTRGEPVRLKGSLWYAISGGLGDYRLSVCADAPVGGLQAYEWWEKDGALRREPLLSITYD